MTKRLLRLLRENRGSTAIEYGMIAALIVVASFAAIKSFSDASMKMWNNVATTVSKG